MSIPDPMLFGLPPEDAVNDPEALAGVIQRQPNAPLFENNNDIPRVEDANPWKTPDGMQKMTPRGEPMPAVAGGNMGPSDAEAVRQAILEQALAQREMSRAYQAKIVGVNEQESEQRKRSKSGEL